MSEEEQVTERVEADAPEVTEPTIEERAASLGWKSPDEWKGDKPRGYIDDPARFVEWAENLGPVKKLVESQQKELEALREQARRSEAAVMRQVERERAQYKANLEAIRAAKAQAVQDGDADAYTALDRREMAMRAEAEDKPQSQAPQMSDHDRRAVDIWVANNSDWFGPSGDKERSDAAVQLMGEATERGIASIEGQLAYVDRQMAIRFPKEQTKPEPVSRFDTALGAGGGQSAFSKLPKEARDQFRRFVEKGVFADDEAARKQYTEDYNAA